MASVKLEEATSPPWGPCSTIVGEGGELEIRLKLVFVCRFCDRMKPNLLPGIFEFSGKIDLDPLNTAPTNG